MTLYYFIYEGGDEAPEIEVFSSWDKAQAYANAFLRDRAYFNGYGEDDETVPDDEEDAVDWLLNNTDDYAAIVGVTLDPVYGEE
jgi:hypothetical protein